jgi:hypothetical protein
VAGADEGVIAAVRAAAAMLPGSLEIATSPNAQVYLDEAPARQTGTGGTLSIEKVKPGSHHLRVSMAGKKDFDQSVTVNPAAVSRITATLADLPATLRITSTPGAEVYLNGVSRGKTDSNGTLTLTDLSAPGWYTLKVTGQTKRKDYEKVIQIAVGRENSYSAIGEASPGSIRVRAAAGAQIYLDNDAAPHVAYFNGEYKVEDLHGSHVLRVLLEGQSFRRSVDVPDGEEVVLDIPHTAQPASGGRLDGLYRSRSNSGNYWDYLRFFPDGSLVLNAMNPSSDNLESLITLIKSRDLDYAYHVQGSNLQFSVNRGGYLSCSGEVDYKAVIKGDTLVAEIRSLCDGKVANDTFKLIESGSKSKR